MLKENITKWRQAETCYFELIHANSNEQEDISEKVKNISSEFDKSLEDDLNTHLALSAFFQLVKETNRLAASEKLGIENAQIIMKEFERISNILGLEIPKMNQEEKQEIDSMITNRERFREEKQFEKADQIRDELNEMNIELIDHKGKTIWMKKEKIKKDC
jgi:cysteinyl-tRNA synthetase